jgi:hypothetical protein
LALYFRWSWRGWALVGECGGHLGGVQTHLDFDRVIDLAIPLNFNQT